MEQDMGSVSDTPTDRGFSLVEVLIAVTLMIIVIIPILMATSTLVRASTTAGASAEAERVVADAADRVTRADAGCDYSSAVRAAVVSRGWPAESARASYQYYLPGLDAVTQGTWSAAGTAPEHACPGGLRSSRLIQLVTITITDDSGHSRSIQVVKSDV